MKAVFVELPAFERNRATYLTDDEFKSLQERLMKNPEAGDMIEGTGGLRKVRHGDPRRGKGTRGDYASSTTGGVVALSFGCLPSTTRTRWKT